MAIDRNVISSIEEESLRLRIHDVAAYLQAHLGQKVTAYLSGRKAAREVGAWARGESTPRGEAVMRLRTAYHVTRLISSAYGDGMARAWLVGGNMRLNNEAPAGVLRYATSPEDVRSIVPAALAFAEITD